MKTQQCSNEHAVFCICKDPGNDMVSIAYFKPRVKKAALNVYLPTGKAFLAFC